MSKKNRRKGNIQKSEPLPRSEFEMNTSKVYIMIALIIFHIIPIGFVTAMFITKQQYYMALYTQFAIYFNSSITAVISFVYGYKNGFNFKFPIVISVIAALSLIFYGSYMPNMILNAFFAFGIVYTLFAFAGILVGAYIKRVYKM